MGYRLDMLVELELKYCREKNLDLFDTNTALLSQPPYLAQEVYRPGTTIYHAVNLCTAVGRDQNKKFRATHHF